MDYYEKRKEYREIMSNYFKIASVYQDAYYKIKNEYEVDLRKNKMWLKLYITDIIVFVSVMVLLMLYDGVRKLQNLIDTAIDPLKIIILVFGLLLIAFLIILNRCKNEKLIKTINKEKSENEKRYQVMENLLNKGSNYAKELVMDLLNVTEFELDIMLKNKYKNGYSKRDICDYYDDILKFKNGEMNNIVSQRERSRINDNRSKIYKA